MHSKPFFVTILLSYAAKSLDSFGNSAGGAWGGARARRSGQQGLEFATAFKKPSIRSTARVLPKARRTLHPQFDCTGTVLPQEKADKNEALCVRFKEPLRQEQEGSAKKFPLASHVGIALLSLASRVLPARSWAWEDKNKEAPLLEVHPFFICSILEDCHSE